MKPTYTKRQALLDCIEMWHELSVTGATDKQQTAMYDRTRISCALCAYKDKLPREFVTQSLCYACPAYGRWGNGTDTCVKEKSYYAKWINSISYGSDVSLNPSKRSRQYWARQIVLMCQQLLFELED